MRFIYVFTVLILLSLSAMAQGTITTADIKSFDTGTITTADLKSFDTPTACVEDGKLVPCFHVTKTPAPKATTQSSDGPGFQMFGGATLGTVTGGGPFLNSSTVAGGFVDPRASFRLFGATVTARGFMAVENGVRYAPGSTDAVLNFVPGMYVGLPLGGNWSFLVGGAADLQRVQGTTIMNPMMSFGVAHNTRDSGQTIVVSYLYDDVIDNGLPQQVFRGYRISPELQKWKGGIGFLAGVDIDRQAQAGLLTTGPRTQAKIRIGIGFRPAPVN